MTRRGFRYLLPLAAVALLGLALVATTGSGSNGRGERPGAVALLKSADGRAVARVRLIERRNGKVAVRVRARGLEPGFHGFHVHEKGVCDPPGFQTAGGHYSRAGQPHGAHAGDMPPLLVTRGGKAEARLVTDRFSIADLRDADGSAVMVHAMPDNFGNVPDRYAPQGTDDTTKKTGDAGARVACAALTAR